MAQQLPCRGGGGGLLARSCDRLRAPVGLRRGCVGEFPLRFLEKSCLLQVEMNS